MNGAPREPSVVPSTRSVTMPVTAPDFAAQQAFDKAGALVMAARSAYRKGNLADARPLLQQALALAPTDCGALELLGDIFLAEAQQEKALRVFEHGQKLHPRHFPFEEKIALCHLDMEEMKRERQRRETLLEGGDPESWMNLAPNRAFGLSVLLPGAGHLYIEDNEKAALIFGAFVLLFLGWSLPLYFGAKAAATLGVHGFFNGMSAALANMSTPLSLWFYLCVAAQIALYVYAAFDAMSGAERANERRQQGWETLDF